MRELHQLAYPGTAVCFGDADWLEHCPRLDAPVVAGWVAAKNELHLSDGQGSEGASTTPSSSVIRGAEAGLNQHRQIDLSSRVWLDGARDGLPCEAKSLEAFLPVWEAGSVAAC